MRKRWPNQRRTLPSMQPRQRRGLGGLIVVVFGSLFLLSSPAGADVDRVEGSAFGASVFSSLLGQIIPPAPGGVAGSATEPANGYGPVTGSSVPISIPTILSTGVLNASTEGGNLAGEDHFGFAT